MTLLLFMPALLAAWPFWSRPEHLSNYHVDIRGAQRMNPGFGDSLALHLAVPAGQTS